MYNNIHKKQIVGSEVHFMKNRFSANQKRRERVREKGNFME